MYYLRVAHVDQQLDEEYPDCDLFSFSTLDNAFEYIKAEELHDYILSDMLLEEYQPEDYTHVHVTHSNEYTRQRS